MEALEGVAQQKVALEKEKQVLMLDCAQKFACGFPLTLNIIECLNFEARAHPDVGECRAAEGPSGQRQARADSRQTESSLHSCSLQLNLAR